jgi:hypothetical protein
VQCVHETICTKKVARRTLVWSTIVMALARLIGAPVVAAQSNDEVTMAQAVEACRNTMNEAPWRAVNHLHQKWPRAIMWVHSLIMWAASPLDSHRLWARKHAVLAPSKLCSRAATPILVRFDRNMLKRVDGAAKRRGVSRSAWIHFMVSRALEQEEG